MSSQNSKQSDRPSSNAEANVAPTSQQDNARVSIVAQYIKDLSFENPKAPAAVSQNAEPRMEVRVDVNVRSLQAQDYEVGLVIAARMHSKEGTIFLVDLKYNGIARLENVVPQMRDWHLFVTVPSNLFPFARRIVHNVTGDGGFPPLMIDPVDFASLFQARIKELQEQQQKAQASAKAPQDASASSGAQATKTKQ